MDADVSRSGGRARCPGPSSDSPQGAGEPDTRRLYEVQERLSPPWCGIVEGLLVLVVFGMDITTLRLSRRVAEGRAT